MGSNATSMIEGSTMTDHSSRTSSSSSLDPDVAPRPRTPPRAPDIRDPAPSSDPVGTAGGRGDRRGDIGGGDAEKLPEVMSTTCYQCGGKIYVKVPGSILLSSHLTYTYLEHINCPKCVGPSPPQFALTVESADPPRRMLPPSPPRSMSPTYQRSPSPPPRQLLFEGVECRCADCKKTQGIRECDMDRNMVCEGCLDFVCADCQKKRAAASGIRNSWDVYGYDLIDYWCTDCHVGRCASCSEGDDLFYKTIKNRCKECRRNYIDARKEKRRRARERGEEYADLKPFRGYHIKVDHVRHIDDGSIDAIEGGDWVPKKRKPTRVLGKRSVKKARRGEKD